MDLLNAGVHHRNVRRWRTAGTTERRFQRHATWRPMNNRQKEIKRSAKLRSSGGEIFPVTKPSWLRRFLERSFHFSSWFSTQSTGRGTWCSQIQSCRLIGYIGLTIDWQRYRAAATETFFFSVLVPSFRNEFLLLHSIFNSLFSSASCHRGSTIIYIYFIYLFRLFAGSRPNIITVKYYYKPWIIRLIFSNFFLSSILLWKICNTSIHGRVRYKMDLRYIKTVIRSIYRIGIHTINTVIKLISTDALSLFRW